MAGAVNGNGEPGITGGLGWGEVEVPVAGAADRLGDQRAEVATSSGSILQPSAMS